MLSYEVYKWVHYVSLFLIFSAFGVILGKDSKWPKALHGVALLFILVSGFGMLAKLRIHWPMPGWVLLKVFVWLAFGGALVVAKKRILTGPWFIVLVCALGGLAAYAALFKPFLP